MADAEAPPSPPPATKIPIVEESPFWFGVFMPSQLSKVPTQLDWLWDGYLARGQITLLTGQWKIGKTALLACLLARLGTGGQLAGRAVSSGRGIVLSEEGAGLWRERSTTFGIGDHVRLGFRPFLPRPDQKQWELFADLLLKSHRERPIELLVVDPLATNWPCADENSVAGVTAALVPLREIAQENIGVLLLHHPRKERLGGGRESRGSGALAAYVDVLMEMRWYGGPDSTDRRRRLLAWSRHDATPRELLIELTADGRDYVPAAPDVPGADLASVVRHLLEAEPGQSIIDLLRNWPADSRPPLRTVLQRHLIREVAANELICTGAGNRYEPYRYRLREPEAPPEGPEADSPSGSAEG